MSVPLAVFKSFFLSFFFFFFNTNNPTTVSGHSTQLNSRVRVSCTPMKPGLFMSLSRQRYIQPIKALITRDSLSSPAPDAGSVAKPAYRWPSLLPHLGTCVTKSNRDWWCCRCVNKKNRNSACYIRSGTPRRWFC